MKRNVASTICEIFFPVIIIGLFLGVRTIAACTNQPYIQCKNCGKWYRRQVEEQAYDESDIAVYYCYCPYCGEEYEWDECYWR